MKAKNEIEKESKKRTRSRKRRKHDATVMARTIRYLYNSGHRLNSRVKTVLASKKAKILLCFYSVCQVYRESVYTLASDNTGMLFYLLQKQNDSNKLNFPCKFK